MESISEKLKSRLAKRREDNAFRSLRVPTMRIDFSSNDYLGLARSSSLKKAWLKAIEQSNLPMGAGGSRLLTGNSELVEKLEQTIARFHHAAAGLVFNSGYDANLGLLSCIAGRQDTIIFDRLVHASIREGIQLSPATSFGFAHNDLEDLGKKLSKAQGQIFLVLESVYSMDGDCAPLQEMAALAKRYHAALIVDEAHATGVYGPRGEGIVVEEELEQEVFARIHTFGKAMGNQGAIILGSKELRDYLINFSRAFIYTTALPHYTLLAIREAYQYLADQPERVVTLKNNIKLFLSLLTEEAKKQSIPSDSAIQVILVEGNTKVKSCADYLQSLGVDVRPILSPTVPKGKERIRICLHHFNTNEDIQKLAKGINDYVANEIEVAHE